MMRVQTLVLAMVCVTSPCTFARAVEQADVSDPMKKAIAALDDEDFAVRAKAVQRLQTIFGEQIAKLSTVRDNETQAGLIPVLAYNDGLTRWLMEVMTLPPDQRDTQLELAKSPATLKVIAGIFSTQYQTRIAAVQEMPKLDGVDIDPLLARMIADGDRRVSLAAMEVAWDRKPTPLIVQALWHKAVEAGIAERKRSLRNGPGEAVSFRGQSLGGWFAADEVRGYDSDVATQVLMHMNAMSVADKVVRVLEEAAARLTAPDFTNFELILISGNDATMRNVYQLAAYFKPRGAVPALYALAKKGRVQTFNYTDNGITYHSSNRAAALAVLLIITGQPHDIFIEKDFPQQYVKSAWVVADEHDEEKVAKDVEAWWAIHSKEYGAT